MNPNKQQNELVSVIVLNYNGAHLLPECIESLQSQDYENIEIIVADNASTDNSVEVAESYGVKIFRMPENRGFSFTNNAAAKIAKGEFIFFVNNDMKFEKNCVSELITEMIKDSTIFAADALHYNWEGTEITNGALKISKSGLKNWFPFVLVDFDVVEEKTEIAWGCSGSLMVRAKMFKEVRGFDDTSFLDGEDLDLCLRAWMKDWKTIHVPSAQLYHKVFGGCTTTPDWRRLSGEQMFLRFVLKVMNKKMIVKIFLAKILQGIGFICIGRFRRGIIIFKAMKITLFNMGEILEQRKRILGASKKSGDEVLGIFLAQSQ
jgi:GT2 family glycosyltransferase